MIERIAFTGIALLGAIVALPNPPAYLYDVVAQLATPTPVPPVVMPAWILGGGTFYRGQQAATPPTPLYYDVDPGALADQHLFAGVLDASATADADLETNCPGNGSGGSNVANCNPYLYINMLALLCDGTLESAAAYDFLNGAGTGASDETGFLHTYAAGIQTPSPAHRYTIAGECPSPTPNPGSTYGFPTNPDDSAFQTWLVGHAWLTANFPVPYGIYEDHFSVVAEPCWHSYEYGDKACNMQGTSHSPDPHDWETALGDFENNAEANCGATCFAFLGNGLTPGGGRDTGPCGQGISSGHCFATPNAGVVDDMDALDNLCAAADSGDHLHGITAEEIAFLKGTPGPLPTPTNTPVYADTQTIVYMINTMSHIVNYTTGGCAKMVAIDIEAAGGSFYPLDNYSPGTVLGGVPVRMEATALRFLVPDLVTLVPDRMQPFYFTIGGTNNNWSPTANHCTMAPYCEVPYMFEETLVPQGPEVPVGAFAWNGNTQSVGDGCPTPTPNPPDTGGAVDLMATCLNDTGDPTDGAAVFRQEYHHLYINGADYGPVAVLLNTATTAVVTIDPTWFNCPGCDPLSSFNYQLTLSGGELTAVPYPGVAHPISLPCTQTMYCTGNDTVSGNTTSFGGTLTIGPHSGVILLGSN